MFDPLGQSDDLDSSVGFWLDRVFCSTTSSIDQPPKSFRSFEKIRQLRRRFGKEENGLKETSNRIDIVGEPVPLADENVVRVFGAEEGVVVEDLDGRHPVGREVPGDLLKTSLHGFVLQQRHRPQEVADEDEVTSRLQVERDDVVEVGALEPQLLLGRPLPQPHLQRQRTDPWGGPQRKAEVAFALHAEQPSENLKLTSETPLL